MSKNTIIIIQDLTNKVNELCMGRPNLNQNVDTILYDRNKHMVQEEKHESMIFDPHISTNMLSTYLEIYPKLAEAFQLFRRMQQTQATASTAPTNNPAQKITPPQTIKKVFADEVAAEQKKKYISALAFPKEKIDSKLRNQDWDQLWFSIKNVFSSLQKEISPRSKKSADGGSIYSIRKESNRGSKN
ncbi:hypothetical protein BB561_004074 [Smittium simulii]|uniref:Uncharacterized protein n=1 Tax=Smittium simulii TaxID=133385 RepID=A0A2T9YI50_9FUNG|nr:hypothetical protein BB561_004074 [Smittium simulii]